MDWGYTWTHLSFGQDLPTDQTDNDLHSLMTVKGVEFMNFASCLS
jgi:hypothetical protein